MSLLRRGSSTTAEPGADHVSGRWTESVFLRQGALRAVLVANAYRPTRSRVGLVPSFFASWLTTEGAPALLALWKVRTLLSWRRHRRSGASLRTADVVGLTLTAGAAVGAVGLIRDGVRSEEEYEAALSSLIPADELEDRPAALRAGALVPLLTGNRRRRRTRNVVFTARDATDPSSVDLSLDVYLPMDDPAPGEKRPAVLQIHGGAWVLGSKNEQGIPLLNHLASCGWVGFNVDYRLSPRVKSPGHLIDCKKALAWIREHADEYGVDPDFIVVTGGSAGGHLCALMALTQNDPRFQPGFEHADTSVQAAVPFYGVYDLTNRNKDYDDTFVQLMSKVVMGVGLDEDPGSWASYSPIDRITADAPPMFVIHGDKDVLVPVTIARAFVKELQAVSTQPVVYAELRGAQHAFEVFPSFRTVRTVEYVERFLHHVHAEYLAASSDPDKVEPVPDDTDQVPVHADQLAGDEARAASATSDEAAVGS
ncbi:MAG: alpha/beta hydrolase fold domain-containing protein [Microthrixaceae bacterium]